MNPVETGLYYLQIRYYNPEMGRFINADDPGILHMNTRGYDITNLYSYCNNNPVNKIDSNGYMSFWKRAYYIVHGIWLITTGLLSVVSAIRKGFVASALGTVSARIIAWLVGTALGMMPLGQYWATIITVGTIITMLWKTKSLLYNIPKGLRELKSALE